MTLGELEKWITDNTTKADCNKDVIVVVKDSEMPYPDVVGLSKNEDTIVLEARIFREGTP